MNLVTFLDTVEFLSALAALAILFWNWRKGFSEEAKVLLAILILFKLYHGFSNIMQWSGITVAFDEWEDYLEIIVPGLWAGFAALFILWRQTDDLLKMDRMRDALIADVSHELKTPVAKHSMQMEIIKPIMQNHELSVDELKALRVMEESIRRQENVIRNLLDLSRLEAGRRQFRRQRVSLNEICSKVLEDYRYEIEVYGLEVTCSVPPIDIVSDGEMLWHLISNLVSNSIKFRREEVPAKVNIAAVEDNGQVTLRVIDNGRGMSGKEIENAFDRFYQTTASAEGSGVGLSICKAIAEGLDCRLGLESPGKGQGTTAAITFPPS
jgi:signal transduction histidine kinase